MAAAQPSPPAAAAAAAAAAAQPAPPPPPPPAAAAQPAPPPAEGAAQPAPPPAAAAGSAHRHRVRADAATALFVIGCAAAVLALFAMTVDPANSGFLLGPSCAPTDEEAADLRAASELLLVSAAAQVIGATVARFATAQPFTLLACALSWPTAYHVSVVLPLLVGCHGRVRGALAVQCWIVNVVMLAALLVATFAAIVPDPSRRR
ncbi:hypothetical protein EJB05_46244 [Eragrostis curvula]|uniref:PGG domain-containing protein n=1 Tax=Eragrostis curvula TaxID=38414 RepID=A0A5J9TMH3_9POAL|nr:hypothetical protein EJB05_46244 [Eragrostis curvula]